MHTPRPPRRPRYRGTHPRRFEERYKERRPEQYPEIHEHVRAQGRTPAGTHVPVMASEVLEILSPTPGEIVLDGTLGHGGHAAEFMSRIGPTGRLIGLDVDRRELERARERLAGLGVPLSVHQASFAGIGAVLAREGLEGYDIIFADLGVSSMQVDDPGRGFSYKRDGPLDMRMDDRLKRTAADLLAALSFEEISAALADLGNEPDHERIARKIVNRRGARPLTRTFELVRLIFEAKKIDPESWRAERRAGGAPAPATGGQPRDAAAQRAGAASRGAGAAASPGTGRLHPAARTFQALRILVNDEMARIEELLRQAPWCLRPGGRIGILSYHSGEEGRVIRAFREGLAAGLYEVAPEGAIRPGREERRANPRSASARFRWARRGGS